MGPDPRDLSAALRFYCGKEHAGAHDALADVEATADVLLAQGKPEEAKAAYQSAWKSMNEKVDYRRLVEAKLTALAAPPAAAASGVAK